MDKNYFELLAKNNYSVNVEMNNIIKALSEEEWNKKYYGYYKSIHELCSHIFIGDYKWLNRYRLIGNYKCFNGVYFNKEYNFQEILFENITEYLSKRHELDKIIIDFTNEFMENDLNKIIKLEFNGIVYEKKMGVCLLHMFNHETHHRGMISLYLENIGKENDYSKLFPYG
jgi:uncharacterized damage-inducible protein DinB